MSSVLLIKEICFITDFYILDIGTFVSFLHQEAFRFCFTHSNLWSKSINSFFEPITTCLFILNIRELVYMLLVVIRCRWLQLLMKLLCKVWYLLIQMRIAFLSVSSLCRKYLSILLNEIFLNLFSFFSFLHLVKIWQGFSIAHKWIRWVNFIHRLL